MILARAPDDLRGLGNELEKLFLFIGPRSALRAQDVETLMTDRGEGWIFDLTRLVGERDAVAALGQLARLMSQGEHPLKLLAVLAAELRRLLSARQLLDTELRRSWRRGMTYDQFQKTVLKNGAPVLSRNAFADYMCFQRASGFSLRALRSYLEAVHETDLRLKSSGGHPRLIMERLILDMCARGQA
jgi:DNA polymerase-3 subunit delta